MTFHSPFLSFLPHFNSSHLNNYPVLDLHSFINNNSVMVHSTQFGGIGPSIILILITSLILTLARVIVTSLVRKDDLSKLLSLEFLATFELIAVAFELGIVYINNGFVPYAGLLLALFIYWGKVWPPASVTAHPYVMHIIERRPDWKISAYKLLMQIAAGCTAFVVYVKPIWGLGHRTEHLKFLEGGCNSALHVSAPFGIFIEAAATITFELAVRTLGSFKHGDSIVPFVFVGLKRMGMKWTGCFLNPVLASALQFGCSGTSVKDHLLVYWGGPILGLVALKTMSRLGIKVDKEEEQVKKHEE